MIIHDEQQAEYNRGIVGVALASSSHLLRLTFHDEQRAASWLRPLVRKQTSACMLEHVW